MTNLILCGGSGTRLWPISRTLMPKQFVKLFNKKSLFQLTVERNHVLCDRRLIVSNREQYFLALDQLEELAIHQSQYLLEPIGRNTAPAIALACLSLPRDELVFITPSDHLIKNEDIYMDVLKQAQQFAKENSLVTFGIKPSFAETGFGYIEANGFEVKAFHEKPKKEIAEKYLEAGNYYWNSGMFMFKAGVFLDEIKKYSPDIFKACETAYKNSKKDSNIVRVNLEDMEKIKEDSIDYAVMEKSNRVKVVPSDIDWSDVGSFDALIKEDLGSGFEDLENRVEIDGENNFYFSDVENKVIATIGLEDFIVIDTKDALLISKKGQTQKVKEIVKSLTPNSSILNSHPLVYRPWGTFETLIEDSGYKIKRIVVKPGKRLSLQKHFHRNEHWIVVSGTATVTVGDKKYLVRPNESTYIKMGEVHRLSNEGKIPIVLIEAQVGEYTGEDDIIRIEDDYKRGEFK